MRNRCIFWGIVGLLAIAVGLWVCTNWHGQQPGPASTSFSARVPDRAVAPPVSASSVAPAPAPASLLAPPLLPTAPLPPSPYAGAKVLAQKESVPDAQGVSVRMQLLEMESKYPYVRVEETRRHDLAGGRAVTVRRVAMVADHILVQLQPEATEAMLKALNNRFGATIRRQLKRPGLYLVGFETFDLNTVPQRVREYGASPMVTEVAEPDYLVEPVETEPNDTRFDELWGLAQIHCPLAWDIETGQGATVVGVIDSGMDYTHEDLSTNLWINPWENPTNGIDDDANGYIDDVYGWDFGNDDADPLGPSTHGTHVAGTIAAAGNNGLGVAGVSWHSRLMILKMFSDAGVGLTSASIDALEYARQMRLRGVPIRVTNNSWGGGAYSSLLKETIAATGDAGMLFVAAAGNYGWDNDQYAFYPSSYECSNILAVAASTRTDALASYSHYGPTTVDLAAPGDGILSTVPGGYEEKSGTSMATPHVSGACALLWEAYPDATWQQVREYIMAGVVTNAYLVNRIVSGGRLDVAGSMYAIAPIIDHDPLINTTNATDAYVISANIAPSTFLVPGSVLLHWNTSGPSSPYTAIPMARVTNDLYQATIPAQPLGGNVYYYLEAQSVGGTTRTDPSTAPETPHHFQVVNPVTLWITGQPNGVGAVDPDYGIYQLPRGITVMAQAEPFAEVTPEHRYACIGWVALGSAPAYGATHRMEFVLNDITAISWTWEFQYALMQSSLPTGIVDTVSWWKADTPGTTLVGPDPVTVSTSTYRFVEWRIDGQRWPDSTNAAPNPAASITMDMARQAVAVYLPEALDGDEDGLPDWWEARYFGEEDATPGDDPDGDTFSNEEELADGTNPRDVDSYPEPPVIQHVPLGDPQGGPAPWPVSAVVTDNFAVASATLHWRRIPETWNTLPMTGNTGSVYEAAIPAPGHYNEAFEYWIEAEDTAGYTNSSPVYGFDVIYPVGVYSPTNIAVLMEPDSVTNVIVTLGNTGNSTLIWSAEAGWLDGAEAGTNSMSHSGINDLWHISTNRAATGAHAWYCGDPNARTYANQVNASLVLPPLFPANGTFLRFQYWADIEYDESRNDDHYWDGGIVEISTNNGTSFVQIEPVGGYPYRITPNDQSPFPYDTPCFAGNGEGWQEAAFDLSPYVDQIVRLRFRFGSDWAAVEEGWYLDDIAVVFPSSSVGWIQMEPNGGSLAPGANGTMTVRLDSTGMSTEALPGMVRLTANDPIHPITDIGVDLAVQAVSDLALLGLSAGGGSGGDSAMVFEWTGWPDRFYTLYQRTSLVDTAESWMPVEGASNIPGITGSMTHTVHVENVTQRFYRLTVQ